MTCGKGEQENGFGHGGNLIDLCAGTGTNPERIIDFSANINPLGPPEYLRKVISRSVESLVHYPDPYCRELMLSLTSSLGLEEQQLFFANGSTEIIYALPRALACRRAIIPTPSYLDYERAAHLVSLESVQMPLFEPDGFRVNFVTLAKVVKPGDLVYLGRPNNPTGISFDAAEMLAVVAQHSEVYFAIDESFFEFVDGSSELISSNMAPNLVVFRSLTKFYAIPGLRLGFGVASPSLAKKIKHYLLPWTVNSLAQAVGTAVLLDKQYAESSRSYVKTRRKELRGELCKISALYVFPGKANYLLIKLKKTGMTAQLLAERLLNLPEPIAIRTCANFVGLDDRFFRVAVRTQEDNKKLCAALVKELESSGRRIIKYRKKTPALMLQGTSSNAGKSVLTAALGRIFLQDGYRVAPFKAQNMSLNSYVTRDGGEMGRAQVVQAQACRLDPEVRMNPVLLKPSSDIGSQVIVNGRPIGNMSVNEYIRFKPEARQSALSAYDSLAAENDIMVLEGAGSPAEVNLKKHDIVNMTMAQHAQSPVLLIGDIDRGGVFASFVGTMEVMAEWERALVAGFIVNRFRGQAALLEDAFRYVEEFTGKGVFGTVPYINNHGLPEEDSVSFKGGLYEKSRTEGESVGIGVIDLPHISNFTDVEPFLIEPDVHLHIIRSTKDLNKIETDLAALILPGSKNVMSDLMFLRRSGLADRICGLADKASMDIIGICGGFQILGKDIDDPFRVESDGGRIEALGILDMTTTLAEEKTLVRQTGHHLPSMQKVQGYEIHHGQTTALHEKMLRMDDGSEGGAVLEDGHVWGSYLHGIFDADDFRRWFIDRLRSSRKMKPLGKVVAPYDLEPVLNRVADIVRESLDIDRIYRLLGLK